MGEAESRRRYVPVGTFVLGSHSPAVLVGALAVLSLVIIISVEIYVVQPSKKKKETPPPSPPVILTAGDQPFLAS